MLIECMHGIAPGDDGISEQGYEMERSLSVLEAQAADALRRARLLSVGPARNDLRQLAKELLWLDHNGMDALVERRNFQQPRDEMGSIKS